MNEEHINLFVYGSLRDPMIFKSVCGLGFTPRASAVTRNNLKAELAILPRHQKVSPDNVYFYAIPRKNFKIEGFVIYDLPVDALNEIDKYEGKYYEREIVNINTAAGPIEAYAYLGSSKQMRRKFGDRFHVNLIHELWLRKRIEKFFCDHTRPGEKSIDADVERRARRELLGTTERDLVVSHLGSNAVSDYFLEHELDRPCPSIMHLYYEEEAKPFIDKYIALVVKQVLLNQFEHKIHTRYRYELERRQPSRRYFTRSFSLLVAMRMINANEKAVDAVLTRCLDEMPPSPDYDLLDYVKYAINAADSIFDSRVAKSQITAIGNKLSPGLMPLGVELEFSNLGYKALDKDKIGYDPDFDGFKYFYDFRLEVLTWKLGGYIDDHSGSHDIPRRRGFFEVAPGRLNLLGDVSKPSSNDPWLMNQLIREIARFYPVRPHSMHLSLQMRKGQIGKQKILPLSFIKCLLALGGGTQEKARGKLYISRLAQAEIQDNRFGDELVFSRTSKRKYHLPTESTTDKTFAYTPSFVYQYKFLRLDGRANYEPLIMALKGLQIACNPADFLTAEQLTKHPGLKKQYQQLKEWANEPTEISRQTRSRFIKAIQMGLMNEAHHQPVHKLHYIDWAMGAIDVQLRLFNKRIAVQT